MLTDYISFRDTNYFSDFICDYLDEKPSLNVLYNRFPSLENFKFQIEEKQKAFEKNSIVFSGEEKRKRLVNVLKQQYSHINASKITRNHIENLRDSKTFTITTGHQLNIFTGPLYFLYKIISTINLAKQLKTIYPQYNFVPIYWMATEDHDFKEINFFNFKRKKIQWNSNQKGAVGHFNTKGFTEIFKAISTEFGLGKHADTLKKWFKDAYVKHNNLAEATCYLANKLFGNYGLVILNSDCKSLKEVFVPNIEKEIVEQTAFNTVTATNKIINSLNLKVQVNPREVNFFYMTNGIRERIMYNKGVFKVNNTPISWSKDGIKKEIVNHPDRFSPNVIMRPLYQEVILPNLCYIGGSGEIIYWLQLKSNFDAHKVTFPMVLLRNSVLFKTKKQSNKQQKLTITNADLFLNRNTFINKKVRQISNINIDFSEQTRHLETQFKTLHKLAEETDKSFLSAVKAQEVKQIKGLKHLEKRLLKAQKRKLSNQIARCTNLQEQLFPNQGLQERHLNFSELYLEYGEKLIPALIKALQPLKSELIILTL